MFNLRSNNPWASKHRHAIHISSMMICSLVLCAPLISMLAILHYPFSANSSRRFCDLAPYPDSSFPPSHRIPPRSMAANASNDEDPQPLEGEGSVALVALSSVREARPYLGFKMTPARKIQIGWLWRNQNRRLLVTISLHCSPTLSIPIN